MAELIAPIVRQDESIRAIRITRLITDLNSTVDESLPPPYVARVIRDGDRVRLVQLQESRLTAGADRSGNADDE